MKGRPKEKYTLVCTVCGKTYEGENQTRKYCGNECKSIIQNRRDECRRLGISLSAMQWIEEAGKALNDTIDELKVTGESYAERQKRMTLESLPKIELR